ncbi:MAG: hypothetical protein AAF602_18405 [Myxococcota bacterium]
MDSPPDRSPRAAPILALALATLLFAGVADPLGPALTTSAAWGRPRSDVAWIAGIASGMGALLAWGWCVEARDALEGPAEGYESRIARGVRGGVAAVLCLASLATAVLLALFAAL